MGLQTSNYRTMDANIDYQQGPLTLKTATERLAEYQQQVSDNATKANEQYGIAQNKYADYVKQKPGGCHYRGCRSQT